jgi:hypothetical protein
MTCIFCGSIECAWCFFRKKRWPCRIGDNVKAIVCSTCLQRLLRGKKESLKKAVEKAMELNRPDQVEVLQHLMTEDMPSTIPTEGVGAKRISLRHKGA